MKDMVTNKLKIIVSMKIIKQTLKKHTIYIIICEKVAALFAVIHMLSYKIPMGIWIYMVLLIIGIPIIWSIAIPKKITA